MTVPGFTQLYFRESVLHGDVQVLTDRGWDHVHLDSSAWESASDMHNSLAAAFGFPDYYGQNLDALVDCLRDVVTGDYGFERLAAGGVVSISGFDHFQRTAAESAHALIDILARSSLEGLLQGFPIVTLLQSDDAKLQVPPLSGQPVVWNPAERLDSTRV